MADPWHVSLPASAVGKFVSKDTLLKVLSTASLRWSRPGTFNDPFDCQPRFRITAATDELVELCVGELLRVIDGSVKSLSLANPLGRLTGLMTEGILQGRLELDEVLSEFRAGVRDVTSSRETLLRNHHEQVVLNLQDSKILCLTKAFEDTLMWSHYASNYSGALIVLGPVSTDSQFRLAEPIQYSDDPIEFTEHDMLPKLLTGQISGAEPEYVNRSIHRIIFTKATSWSYEREWRIFAGSGFSTETEFEFNRFHPDDALAVVFGAKYPESEIMPLIDVASGFYSNIEWFKAGLSSSDMKLSFQSLKC
jgi:Protein of unknown function (DUF2971)